MLVSLISNLLTEFALIGLLVGILIYIFTNYIFLWIGLKIFKVATVSKLQILLYAIIVTVLGYIIAYLIGFATIGILGEILQSLFIKLPPSLTIWLIYIVLSYLILRFLFRLIGGQLWKLLVYLIVINLLFSYGFNFQNFKQLITQKPPVSQSTNSLKDKTIEEQQNIKSRDSARKTDLYKVRVALEEYYVKNRSYPSTENTVEQINKENYESSILYKALVPNFLVSSLFDPSNNSYTYKSDSQNFELTAKLENPNDPDCQIENGECIYKPRPLGSHP